MKNCEYHECCKTAKYHPVIKIWAVGHNKSHKPARAVLSLGLCDEHMKATTIDDFIDDDGWSKLISGFVQENHAMPDRASAELGRQKIKSKNIMGH